MNLFRSSSLGLRRKPLIGERRNLRRERSANLDSIAGGHLAFDQGRIIRYPLSGKRLQSRVAQRRRHFFRGEKFQEPVGLFGPGRSRKTSGGKNRGILQVKAESARRYRCRQPA